MPVFEILYLVSAALLTLYGLNSLALTWICYRSPKSGDTPATTAELSNYPRITVQLPVYNERHVVKRLIEAVVKALLHKSGKEEKKDARKHKLTVLSDS